MARIARVVAPGCWHHITQRGNRRQTVFDGDLDRSMYLKLLAHHCQRNSVRIAGYCLMGNHIHLLAIPQTDTGLAISLGRTHCDYARWRNMRQGEVGHLWQNRFYSCVVGGRHRWEALRYVELNPVRAALVKHAVDWPWSSAVAHVTGVERAGLLDAVEWQLRWDSTSWRHALEEGIRDADLLGRIRESTRTGRPVGEDDFIAELEARVGRALRPQKRGPKCKTAVASEQFSFEVT